MAKINIYWSGFDICREVGQEETEVYKNKELVGRYINISLAFDAIRELTK